MTEEIERLHPVGMTEHTKPKGKSKEISNTSKEKISKLIKKTDGLIWTFRNNPSVMQNPKMYGWVDVDVSGKATRVSCKEPLSTTPLKDHAVIGAFSFRKAETFLKSVDKMILKNRKINNEFYLDVAMDECISLGNEVRPFEVNKYVCWGTPNDLEAYQNGL